MSLLHILWWIGDILLIFGGTWYLPAERRNYFGFSTLLLIGLMLGCVGWQLFGNPLSGGR